MHSFRSTTGAGNATNNTSSMDTDPVINYELPLMNSLETLIHNEKYIVKRPAGILNSISVPLLTYSSSLERGTVFAADPGVGFNMPFVPFLENNHKEYKARSSRTKINRAPAISSQDANKEVTFTPSTRSVKLPSMDKPIKKYANVKPMSLLKYNNSINDSLVPKESVQLDNNSNTNSSSDNIKVNPRTFIIKNARYFIKKKVSIGLKTLITAQVPKTDKKSLLIANTTNSVCTPTTKSMKQYTNTKMAVPQVLKNIVFQSGSSEQYTTVSIANENKEHKYEATGTDSFNDSVSKKENGNENIDSSTFEMSLNQNSETDTCKIISDDDSTADTKDNSLVNSQEDESTSELLFVPYSQYSPNVAPESTNAHIGEGTLDYGLPLMNCIGTVFQGNIQSITKSEDEESFDEDAIDIPLMKCFKTLEKSSLI